MNLPPPPPPPYTICVRHEKGLEMMRHVKLVNIRELNGQVGRFFLPNLILYV